MVALTHVKRAPGSRTEEGWYVRANSFTPPRCSAKERNSGSCAPQQCAPVKDPKTLSCAFQPLLQCERIRIALFERGQSCV